MAKLTIYTSIVWLYVHLLDYAIHNDKCIPLRPWVSKYCRGVKRKIESFCELSRGIAEETNLYDMVSHGNVEGAS